MLVITRLSVMFANFMSFIYDTLVDYFYLF